MPSAAQPSNLALLNTIVAEHNAAWRKQIRAARRLLGTRPAAGTLTVLVTHGVVVQEATGQTLEEGEAIESRRLGNSRYRVVGRVMPERVGNTAATVPTSAAGVRVRQSTPCPPGSHPHDVAPAPDGKVWYTAQHTGKLGLLDPATGKTDGGAARARLRPHGVIVGPDGAPWVTDGGLNAIVRVDPQTRALSGRFRLPASTGYTNLNTAYQTWPLESS